MTSKGIKFHGIVKWTLRRIDKYNSILVVVIGVNTIVDGLIVYCFVLLVTEFVLVILVGVVFVIDFVLVSCLMLLIVVLVF